MVASFYDHGIGYVEEAPHGTSRSLYDLAFGYIKFHCTTTRLKLSNKISKPKD